MCAALTSRGDLFKIGVSRESEPSMALPTRSASSALNVPDAAGRFGAFGGRYVPETLTRALDELTAHYAKARQDPAFQAELDDLLQHYVGRPSPLYFAR